MKRDKQTLLKYLTISENEVKVNFPCIIRIPSDEYKFSDNDLLDEEDFQLLAGEESSFKVPGTFEIEFPEQGETINIFLPYPVNILKPDEFVANSKGMIFEYEEGDTIFNAYSKVIETNIETLNNLFENRVKFLRGYEAEQIEAIWSQLESTTNYSAHHIELILSLLYATKGPDSEPVLVRHAPQQEYKKEYAINTKDSSHFFSMGAQSFNYGYTNDAIWQSINKNRSEKYSKVTFDEVYPDELDTSYSKAHPTALNYKHAQQNDSHGKATVQSYTDLENLMAGRYDELIKKKNEIRNPF